MNIDPAIIDSIEFGVGRDAKGVETFGIVPVDSNVRDVLVEMLRSTLERMRQIAEEAEPYEPSEKYSGEEFLYVHLSDELASSLRDLHEATNLPIGSTWLENVDDVFCYFCRFRDESGRVVTAVRRAAQFKALRRSKVVFFDDSIKLVPNAVFKLDHNFDLLIDIERVWILRPSGFEYTGKLQDAILRAVPKNLASVREDLPFVDLASIEDYCRTRPRAARYLASIRANGRATNIDKQSLVNLCENTGVEIKQENEVISIEDKQEMAFLEVLDRRRYPISLVADSPERYRASSRKEIKK